MNKVPDFTQSGCPAKASGVQAHLEMGEYSHYGVRRFEQTANSKQPLRHLQEIGVPVLEG